MEFLSKKKIASIPPDDWISPFPVEAFLWRNFISTFFLFFPPPPTRTPIRHPPNPWSLPEMRIKRRASTRHLNILGVGVGTLSDRTE